MGKKIQQAWSNTNSFSRLYPLSDFPATWPKFSYPNHSGDLTLSETSACDITMDSKGLSIVDLVLVTPVFQAKGGLLSVGHPKPYSCIQYYQHFNINTKICVKIVEKKNSSGKQNKNPRQQFRCMHQYCLVHACINFY